MTKNQAVTQALQNTTDAINTAVNKRIIEEHWDDSVSNLKEARDELEKAIEAAEGE